MDKTPIRHLWPALCAAALRAGYTPDDLTALHQHITATPPAPKDHPALWVRLQHRTVEVDRPAAFGAWLAGGNTITTLPAATKAKPKAKPPTEADLRMADAIAEALADLPNFL